MQEKTPQHPSPADAETVHADPLNAHANTWVGSAEPPFNHAIHINGPWETGAQGKWIDDPGECIRAYVNRTAPLRQLRMQIEAAFCAHGEDWNDDFDDIAQPSAFLLVMLRQWGDAADDVLPTLAHFREVQSERGASASSTEGSEPTAEAVGTAEPAPAARRQGPRYFLAESGVEQVIEALCTLFLPVELLARTAKPFAHEADAERLMVYLGDFAEHLRRAKIRVRNILDEVREFVRAGDDTDAEDLRERISAGLARLSADFGDELVATDFIGTEVE